MCFVSALGTMLEARVGRQFGGNVNHNGATESWLQSWVGRAGEGQLPGAIAAGTAAQSEALDATALSLSLSERCR